MTQVVSTPNCEGTGSRQVNDFMYVESKTPKKLNKRLLQGKMNLVLKQTEQVLDKDLLDYFTQNTDLVLKSTKIYHGSHLLAKDLRIANFRQHSNGLTFIVFEFENHVPLFHFAICSKEDNFSRLEGRLIAKKKALFALTQRNEQGQIIGSIENLYTYPSRPEYTESINPLKIGNWIVKHHILPEKEKDAIYVNPLKYQNEDQLLEMAKHQLSTKHNIDISTIRLHTQYIRFYSNSLFSHGLVCTPEWFKELDQEQKKLISTGGYTVYAMIGQVKDTDTKEVFATFSRCSDEEAFVKSYGRKQCLKNFIEDKIEGYSLSAPIDNFKEALVTLAENKLSHAINIKVESDKVSSLVKS